MDVNDNRIIWKEKDNLTLLMTIKSFMDKHGIQTVRQYQKELGLHEGEVPSIWFIFQKYGSWENLQKQLGSKTYDRYRWNQLSDSELLKLTVRFITEENIKSQRQYEKKCVGKNLPSLSTLKKRYGNVSYLFKASKIGEPKYSNFQLLEMLKEEIIELGLEESLSRTEFEKRYNNSRLPSPITLMRTTGKSWEELMKEIGFDYQIIKVKKLTRNFE